MVIPLLVIPPLVVTLCNVLMLLTVMLPVVALREISVPLVNDVTPKLVNVTVPVLELTPM